MNLKQQQTDVNDLLNKTASESTLTDQQPLLNQLKTRIESLIPRAEQGVVIITVSPPLSLKIKLR